MSFNINTEIKQNIKVNKPRPTPGSTFKSNGELNSLGISGTYVIDEDFMTSTGSGNYNWSADNSGTGAGNSILAGEVSHPGIIQFSTGTSTSGRSGLRLSSTSMNSIIIANTDIMYIMSIISLPTLPTVAENYTFRVGIGNNLSATPTHGCIVELTASSSNFVCRNVLSSSSSTSNGPVAVANTWTKIEILIASTNVKYYFNGSLGATIATNTPFNQAIAPIIGIQKTAGTTARTVKVDNYYLSHEFGTSR